jgi:hypothetical protein
MAANSFSRKFQLLRRTGFRNFFFELYFLCLLFIFFNILLVPLLLRLERVEGCSGRQLFGGIAHGLPVFLLPCALRFRTCTTLIVNGRKLETMV